MELNSIKIYILYLGLFGNVYRDDGKKCIINLPPEPLMRHNTLNKVCPVIISFLSKIGVLTLCLCILMFMGYLFIMFR